MHVTLYERPAAGARACAVSARPYLQTMAKLIKPGSGRYGAQAQLQGAGPSDTKSVRGGEVRNLAHTYIASVLIVQTLVSMITSRAHT